MQISTLMDKYSVKRWSRYKPNEAHYTRYLPYQILAGFKIEDVYKQFSNARSSLLYMETNDYGKLISKDDEIHLAYIRSKFLFDALANYNYCIDLSWQFLYLYYGYEDYGMLQDTSRYENETKKCKKDTLEYRLVGLAKERKKYNFLMDFFHSELSKEIRYAYNYIKHRGTYNINGLDASEDDVFPVELDGNTLRMITRETMDLAEWKEKLIQFDISFYSYFETLIRQTMPNDFTDSTFSFLKLIGVSNQLDRWHQASNSKIN
ncbi:MULTISPECIES: hypothetical protein [unclassified Priestia]|uniref:hypothetical protein n=1 Tax=unclassified Priestia TaxID=2800374 RepID=UPI00366CE9F9